MVGKTNSYDVVVVGAGPTGSQIAYKLAEMGHNIGVVERKKTLDGVVCCTGLVSRECCEKYSIPPNVISRWVNGAQLFPPSGKTIRIQRDEPQVAVLNRTAFNQAWAERAQKSGAEYLFDCNVKGIECRKAQAKVEIFRQGETLTLQSRAIVVATGFGTQLLDNLGLGGAGDFVMGAQAEVDTKDISEVEVYFGSKIAPEFFAWLVPTSPGKALAGLLSRRDSPFYLRKLLASLVAGGKITSADVRLTYGGVSLKPLPHTHSDNLLVVGTAAGQVKPITGGGIYFGLICADIAANTLHRALESDNLSADALAGYERAWRRKLARELRTGYWARKAYEMLNDHQVDKAFGLLESTGIIEEFRQAEELSFDWHADVVSRLMGQKLFARALSSIRKPFNRKEQTGAKKEKQ
ncbi:MAG: NAD(P)/FAD-dependent oxidoreductase [Dehalococcoidales bacterium]|nr:NAD(P)/FAD-dependent oxidoreductase [Dehalococcoidales bacterium]